MLAIILTLSILFFGSATGWILAARTQPVELKKILLYMATAIAIFAGLGMAGALSDKVDIVWLFIGVEAAMLLAGMVHLKILSKLFSGHRFVHNLLFSGMIASLGSLVFFLVFDWKDTKGFGGWFTCTEALFLLPLLVLECFGSWQVIPVLFYRLWFYPVNEDLPLIELGDTVQFHIRVAHSNRSFDIPKVAVQMPPNRKLGELFQYFVYRYNTEKEPSNPMPMGSDGQLYGWLFYRENWLGTRRILEPGLTLAENGISPGSTITALASEMPAVEAEMENSLFG